jgi:hypothetical protein
MDKSDKPLEKTYTPKKPYEKPAFRYEKVFETSALSCGKTGILPLKCTLNIKNS